MRFGSAELLVLATVAAAAGCGTDEEFNGTVPVPTEVAVDPTDFLGTVRCSVNEGAMRSFVVTLTAWDDLDDISPFPVGSSMPTPCSLLAGFRSGVVVGSRYSAQIDGYELAPEQLMPFGGASSGSRSMLDAETSEPVAPRWSSRCGDGVASAVVALENRRVRVRPCTPALDMGSSATALKIAPEQLLGDGACARGQSFDLVDESGTLAPITGLRCDAEPIVVDVDAATHLTLYVTAHTPFEPDRGAECQVLTAAGETVTPTCNPFTSDGGVRVRLDGLMTADADPQPACPAGAFFDVLFEGVALNAVPLPCTSQALIQPLAAGVTILDVVVFDAQGTTVGAGAICGAEVLPGKTVDALCLP
jgi:hypothetical protein